MKKLLLPLALLVPLPLAGQSGTTIASYVASDGGVEGNPLVLGATLSRETWWTALRLGASVDVGSTPIAPRTEGEIRSDVGVFGADADGLLYLGSPTADWPVVPYTLVGLGLRVLNGARAEAASASWSYGAGMRTPLTRWLSFEGEARHREPLDTRMAAVPTEVSAGWEFRFGMNLRLSGARPRSRLAPALPAVRYPTSRPAAGAPAARRAVAERALETASRYVGVPYKWGGNTPDEGFDCSGFIRYVYAQHGVDLPRVSRDQAQAGTPLPLDLAVLEPGDLIAFASRNGVVDHIAIYVGDGRIIHSSSSGRGVRFDDLNSRRGQWYRNHMVAARRVIEGGEWSWSAR